MARPNPPPGDSSASITPVYPSDDDHDEQLGEAIEIFLERVEAGEPVDAEAFAAGYPELADDLKVALDGLAMVQGLVGSASSGPGARLETGRRVAGYRIVRELGRGGMGVVYEAVHVDLDRPVALKVLGMHAAPDSTGRRRFLNEAKTAAGLHHTHIVPVFDVGQVGGLCYYAMQRIEGSGLDRVLKALRKGRTTAAGSATARSRSKSRRDQGTSAQMAATIDLLGPSVGADPSKSWFNASAARRAGGPMPLDELAGDAPPFDPPRGSEYYRWVACVGQEAADALAHAHERGVVHRDIKPSNLLVDAKGTVWVADFGLARRVSDPSVTQTESLVGTPRYMSPEQAVQGSIDTLTDVYSLGATLYEMLTLRPPHDGTTTAELIGQIRDKEPASPRKHDPRIPRDLETIVLKAMAKHKTDRYGGAGELADDLGRFLATEPVRARRISPVGRAWRFARRHPSLAAVTSVAAAAILATATVAYVRVVQERNKALLAQATTEKALKGEKRARVQNLWREASFVRLSRVPNLRKTGLARLVEAVALGPDPAMTRKLRDEAVQFLSLRDIEPRPSLPTGPTWRLAFLGEGDRLATLSAGEDGAEVAFWDVTGAERTARHPLSDLEGERSNGRGRNGVRTAPGLAAFGSRVAVPRPGGEGVRVFDAGLGATFTDVPMPGRKVADLMVPAGGLRLVTIEDLRFGKGGVGPDRSPAESFRVTLWDSKRLDAPIAELVEPEPEPLADAPPQSARGMFRPFPIVACSPDGETLAVAWFGEQVISLWSAEDGRKLGEVDAGTRVGAIALGPSGVLVAAVPGTLARWDVATRKPLASLNLHQPFVTALRFSPDGSMLAAWNWGNGIEVWDPRADAPMATIPTSGPIHDVAFAPDGRTMAAAIGGPPGSGGQVTRVWAVVEPIGRSRVAAPEDHPDARLADMAFSPTGTLAATFVDLKAGHAAASVQCVGGGMTVRDVPSSRAVTFDPKGRLAVPDGGELDLYRTARDESPARSIPLPAPAATIDPIPFPGADATLVLDIAASADGRTLLLIRLQDALLVRFPMGKPEAAPTVAVLQPPPSPERRGGGPGRPRGGRDGGPPPGPGPGPGPGGRGSFRNLALAPAGDRLYLASDRGDLRIWELDGSKAEEVRWDDAPRDVLRIAPDPRGRFVALGHPDGSVSIVSAADGARLGAIPAPGESETVHALAASRNGQLAVGFRSGLIQVWAIGDAGQAQAIVTLPSHQREVRSLSYAPDGRKLAVGDDLGADVWNLDGVRASLAEIGLEW